MTAPNWGRRITTADVAAEAEISYRQLDHWIRLGYVTVRPRPQTAGSGIDRQWEPDEANFVVEMGALVNAGMTPALAAILARQLQNDRIVPVDEHHYLVRVP